MEKPQLHKEEEEEEEEEKEKEDTRKQQQQLPHISPMEPLTKEAYGGGMYGKDDKPNLQQQPPASATQSADGPAEATAAPKHTPPPSTGDRDRDITGQSYIQ
ncbi:uncharacterized protein LOC127256882 [Andrographis paniculata]|uniref:uncharacterized protein LOC127256882 n=1 Tax=Andrographis paniculata TaxID=175694 RepID=UPI0021E9598E|nr:uncharacterized protein LOC127256882 [Andrographis paniculata]